MITFEEIDKNDIYHTYNNHYFDDARYFNVIKNDKLLCIYGIRDRNYDILEAFWILPSFNKNILNKRLFNSLFNHCFSLGYKYIFTWSRCEKLINVFSHFSKFGIEKLSSPPPWDDDTTKTWFMKRL